MFLTKVTAFGSTRLRSKITNISTAKMMSKKDWRFPRFNFAGSTGMGRGKGGGAHVTACVVLAVLRIELVLTTHARIVQTVTCWIESMRTVRSRVIRPVLAGLHACRQVQRASGPFFAIQPPCGSQPDHLTQPQNVRANTLADRRPNGGTCPLDNRLVSTALFVSRCTPTPSRIMRRWGLPAVDQCRPGSGGLPDVYSSSPAWGGTIEIHKACGSSAPSFAT